MIKKKINKKQQFSFDSERRLGTVLEDIDSKLDLVVEGHKALDGKIDAVDSKVDNLREEMNYKFGIVLEKFDEVDKKFDEVTGELRIIRNELIAKVGRDEFILLEKRVAALEKAKR